MSNHTRVVFPGAARTWAYHCVRNAAARKGLRVWLKTSHTPFLRTSREVTLKTARVTVEGITATPQAIHILDALGKTGKAPVRNAIRLIVSHEAAHRSQGENSLKRRYIPSNLLEARANREMIADLLQRCGVGSVTEVLKEGRARKKFIDHASDFFAVMHALTPPAFRHTGAASMHVRFLPYVPARLEEDVKKAAASKLAQYGIKTSERRGN